MPKQQKTYTREFKLEAMLLVKSSGKTAMIVYQIGYSGEKTQLLSTV